LVGGCSSKALAEGDGVVTSSTINADVVTSCVSCSADDQIRTISTLRLTKRIDSLSTEKAARLRELIIEMYGLP